MDDDKKREGTDFREGTYSPLEDSRMEDSRMENSRFENSPIEDGARPSGSSYYYSYGPYKSGAATSGSQISPTSREQMQVTTAQPQRTFTPVTSASGSGWSYQQKRRSSFKSLFASFMAGVLVVGALMAVADYQNWFTTAGPLATGNSETPAVAGTSAGTTVNGAGTASTGSTVSGVLSMSRPDNIAQIFEQSSPAVVKIETYARQQVGGNGLDPFFRQFFGDRYQAPERNGSGNGDLVPSGIGSGFFFEDDGYILTNEHVIGSADRVEVTVQGFARPFEAQVLGTSFELDLAVLKIEGEEPFPTLPLGSSDAIAIGDWVIAIGNPHGFDHTVTVGVLSSKERPISIPDQQGTRNYEHLLQTDASINPGNSGGPLLNTNGEVIGINTAVSASAQGIGFAIPTSTIAEVLENLKANVEIPRPFIGVELLNLNEEYAAQLGIDITEGALVTNVLYNSPAYRGDMRQFDVVTEVNGQAIANREELIAIVQEQQVGAETTFLVLRNGQELELTLEIGDRNTFNSPQQPR